MDNQLIDSKEINGEPAVMIDRRQIRMARAGLGWSAEDLAEKSGLGVATIRRAEGDPPSRVSEGNLYVIQHALEAAGVVFLDDNQASPGGGRGVRLSKQGDAQ